MYDTYSGWDGRWGKYWMTWFLSCDLEWDNILSTIVDVLSGWNGQLNIDLLMICIYVYVESWQMVMLITYQPNILLWLWLKLSS